ncbi:1410_t:CDS:2 [Funneliformis caledonium]|uniref:1410_t:CDS:1 n=1 Tax=Funneliformis caledonium TaxID=1117310 RepID=A0A9N8WMU4_9GLOM|nr:1410_t:CDS:2 [Funneliformis caledonium]
MFSSNLIKNHFKIPNRSIRTSYLIKKKIFPILSSHKDYYYGHSPGNYFSSTRVSHDMSIKSEKLLVPSIIGNKDHCPGCGACFQTLDSTKPGYLIKPTHSKGEKVDEKRHAKKLTKHEIEDAIDNLSQDLKGLMYPLGYSKSARKTRDKEETIFCQRCYNLRYHNKIINSSWQDTLTLDKSFLQFLQKKQNSIILTVIDIFDFPGSLTKDLDQLIGRHHSNILIANKIDLLPKDIDPIRIKMWLKEHCSMYGLNNIQEIFLCSAKKNWNIKELCNEISRIRNYNDDIYLIGNTNVGKSELINSLLRTCAYHGGGNYKVTSSHIPGTTVNMFGLPLDLFNDALGKNVKGMIFNEKDDGRFLFDTPGIVGENQILSYLNQEELKMVIPQRNILPLTFEFKPGKSLLFGGLGRIDYKEGNKPIRITVFSKLISHITSIEKANDFYEQLSSCDENHFLEPPIGSIDRLKQFPRIIKCKRDLKVIGECHPKKSKCILDVVWGGIGWCSIGGVRDGESVIFDVWSPNGKGVYTRHVPLLPYEFRGKLEKIN